MSYDWEAQQAEAAARRQAQKDQMQQDRQDRFARVLKSTKVDLDATEVQGDDPMSHLRKYKQEQTDDLSRILAEAEAARAKAKYGTDKS